MKHNRVSQKSVYLKSVKEDFNVIKCFQNVKKVILPIYFMNVPYIKEKRIFY